MTLIELVAAVAVLAIITTELLVLRVRAMELSGEARNTRVAKELARLKMEEYLAYTNNVPETDTATTMNLDQPTMEGEFDSHPGFFWEFTEESHDFDLLLPEDEETTDPEEEEEEDVEHYMVMVTLLVYRRESTSKEPDVLIVLSTLREETPEEASLNVP
jgi:hypothetical protein